MAKKDKAAVRRAVHTRIRRRVRGTQERPRLAIFRSLNHIYAQVIDDERAVAAGVEQVVFDRGGFRFHGRIKALTDAAREAGLNKNERSEEDEAHGGGEEAAA